MALCRAAKDYYKEGGATNDEIDDFLDFCSMFSKGKKSARYECNGLQARLFRHCRTQFKKHDCFDFDKCLEVYFTFASEGKIVDAEPPDKVILVSPIDFVKYVVKHLDKSF